MEQISLSILGSSSAIPLSNRSPSAQFLSIADEHFLIDCGEGTQVKLRQHRIGFSRIKHILISHLHGDHFYGLIPLLTSLQLLERQQAVHLYGPQELEEVLRTFLKMTQAKIQYPLKFHPLNKNSKTLIYESEQLEVHSFPLRHSVDCFGFYFQEKARPRKMNKELLEKLDIPVAEIRGIKNGKDWLDKRGKRYPNEELTLDPPAAFSYAYCSDTLPVKHLHRYFKGVDLLYHEATFLNKDRERALATTHSTAEQAAEIAEICDARYLLLGHFSARYRNFDPIIEEARTIFKRSYEAREGFRFYLNRDRESLQMEKESKY